MIQSLTIAIEDTQKTDGMSGVGRAVKRSFDVVAALAGLVALSPVMLYIAFKLKRLGTGPVLYRQERIGLHGEPFMIMKFRTMDVGAEDDEQPHLAQKDDEHVFPFGRRLRDHHLDELPQLWNVLVGDMSFVGPRPERQFFIDQIMEQNPDYVELYRIRPGITSMASIYNGYTDTMEKMLIRLQMDLDYLRRRSVWMDAKIIFTTVRLILNGKKF